MIYKLLASPLGLILSTMYIFTLIFGTVVYFNQDTKVINSIDVFTTNVEYVC